MVAKRMMSHHSSAIIAREAFWEMPVVAAALPEDALIYYVQDGNVHPQLPLDVRRIALYDSMHPAATLLPAGFRLSREDNPRLRFAKRILPESNTGAQ